jgi:hypothetical protein
MLELLQSPMLKEFALQLLLKLERNFQLLNHFKQIETLKTN